MLVKNSIRSIVRGLSVIVLLSACAKTSYDGPIRPQILDNKMTPPPAQRQGNPDPGPTPTPTPTPAPPSTPIRAQPIISFTRTLVYMDSLLRTIPVLELQLSQAATEPVTAVVILLDDSAKLGRDYNGFNGVRENEYTVVFPIGTTKMPLPMLRGRERQSLPSCNGVFNAQIDASRLQGARVYEATAKVIVPCSARPDQPPVCPPQPPNPPVPEVIHAHFETPVISINPSTNRSFARIVLDRTSSLPVTIALEARNVNGRPSFRPVSNVVVIPANSMSVDIPLDIVRADICANPPATTSSSNIVDINDFNVVVTDIQNAEMNDRTAQVNVFDDTARCCAPRPDAPAWH